MRLLGIDPGTKRIGFALSDDMLWTARPLEVWRRKTPAEDVARVVALVAEHEVGEVIVGVPYSLEGGETASTQKAKVFLAQVRAALPELPVTERDEALTTWEAEEALKARGVLPKDRRAMIDAYAAAVILQEVLDERGRTSGSTTS